MRRRNSSARWLLLALLAAPGCLFRPIFHPPTATSGDGGVARSDTGTGVTSDSGADTGIPVPTDDCSPFFDSTTGQYAPDAHHVDGAACELPGADAGSDDGQDAVGDDAVTDDAVTDASDAASPDASE